MAITLFFHWNIDISVIVISVSDDTAILYGVQFYNDLLSEAGPLGNVQSELLFRKDKSTFTFEKGWAFPRRIYFNGDNCVMPPPDTYPWLPNSSPRHGLANLIHFTPILAYILLLFLDIWVASLSGWIKELLN